MNKFNKGDKVIITGTDDIWEGKTGKVIEESSDEIITTEGLDLTEVTVNINFNDKNIIQVFPRENVELYTINENKKTLQEYYDMDNVQDFINHFIGKKVVFDGFDYRDYYQTHEIADGVYDFSSEDKEEIDYFKSLEGKVGTIEYCAIPDGFEIYNSLEENFQNCYWDVRFDDDKLLDGISGLHLTLLDKTALKESKEPKLAVETEREDEFTKEIDLDEDYIHDYVYFVDLDDNEIPSWYFVNKIATAENKDENTVLDDALRFKKYKVYAIRGNNDFYKMIILAPKCKIEDVYADYIDYIPGQVSITEVL